MSLKQEFVALATQEGANRRSLCARIGISPKTGYKWLQRFAGQEEPSQRPMSQTAIFSATLGSGSLRRESACSSRRPILRTEPRRFVKKARRLG